MLCKCGHPIDGSVVEFFGDKSTCNYCAETSKKIYKAKEAIDDALIEIMFLPTKVQQDFLEDLTNGITALLVDFGFKVEKY